MAGEMGRLRRGEHVQLRAIPGVTGRVSTDLSGWTPPHVEVRWDHALSGFGVVPVDLLERVTPTCEHDWQQAEIDVQECATCGATRHAYSGWQPF